mmetsp:Transcript_3941/g.9272  ORF Transcript_3941/g.9272 Transcript_3941/m.9272 type:complete len:392 (-) Transcript_3941:114-1289(-)
MAGATFWRPGPDPRTVTSGNHRDFEEHGDDYANADVDIDVQDAEGVRQNTVNDPIGVHQVGPTTSSSSSSSSCSPPWSAAPPASKRQHLDGAPVIQQQQQPPFHGGSGLQRASTDAPTAMSDFENPQSPTQESMLEHPIFVYWCLSCGMEAQEDAANCPVCGGVVQRQQRILEVPDEDVGTLSLASLRAALADVSASEDLGASAVLLAQQGPDPGVASIHPKLAEDLVELGVPPAVQRALVERGFQSLDQITAAAAAAPGDHSLSAQLGLTPAAEILLRRLRTAQDDRGSKKGLRKRTEQGQENPRLDWRVPTDVLDTICMVDSDSDVNTSPELDASLAAKRLRALDPEDSTTDEQDMLEETDDVEPGPSSSNFPGFSTYQPTNFPMGLYL